MSIYKKSKTWLLDKPYTKAMYITAFATVVAAVVSCIALSKAMSANRLAQEAIDSNRELFFSQMKPYIVLGLQHVDDSGKFYTYKFLPDDKSVIFVFEGTIRNIGRAGADSIEFFLDATPYYEGYKGTVEVLKPVTMPSLQDLGPGELRNARFEITVEIPKMARPEVYQRIEEKLKAGSGFEFDIAINVEYTNEISPEMNFRSNATHLVSQGRAKITSGNYKQTN